MIFVAVGTQFPFDRLIKYMDDWAKSNEEKVIAQISEGEYLPENVEWHRFLEGNQYNEYVESASVFVSHAGMGNIITARENQTPIIVMNRQFALGEHRNDHQAEGLNWMGKLEGVYTASNQSQLFDHLAQSKNLTRIDSSKKIVGNSQLSSYIADFIDKHSNP